MTLVEEVREKLKVFDYSGFTFDPIPHKYYVDGVELRSVTTTIADFHEHFDANAQAPRSAEKETKLTGIPITAEEILQRWKEINIYSTEIIGTPVHEFIENYLDGIYVNIWGEGDEFVYKVFKFLKIYNERLKFLNPIGQEIRMFSKRMKLAGTFDFLAEKDGHVYILDWKTNKVLKHDNHPELYRNRYGEPKYMYPPFQNCADHNFNHYSIQTSIYRLMMKLEANIDVKDCFIVYIPQVEFDPNCKAYYNKKVIGLGEPAQIIKCLDYRPQLIKHFGLEDVPNLI
jgi:hypothetical protein